ncbi:MAG: diguanylate cyclase [Oscillospiraceae bacterium]|nr:diguanylate cyclase [Oscillospiraceae bacterium]
MDANILIVEDSKLSIKLLKTALKNEHCKITVSKDGKNLKSLILKHSIDIVLLDIILPQTDGFDLLQELVEDNDTKDTPVIVVSNLTDASDVKRALDLGAMDYVRKSFDPIEIIARVHSALKLKRKHDLLLKMSQKDTLTQIYNKQYFNMAFKRILNEKEKHHKGIAMIMIDCDHFKRINDRYGHMFGDMVLCEVANAIEKSIKHRDIACRFGGEEFCVIAPNATPFQAYAIAERIRTNVGKIVFKHEDEDVSVTVSCGVSHLKPKDDTPGSQIVNESDLALYEAKQNGRNQTVLSENHRPKYNAANTP